MSDCPLIKKCPFFKIHFFRDVYGVRNVPCFDYKYYSCEIYKKCGELQGEQLDKCLEKEWNEFKIVLLSILS